MLLAIIIENQFKQEYVMAYFIIIFVLVLVAVDLLVRFVIEPLILASEKKSKNSKTFVTKFDPSIRLATETMFDGGKPHNEDVKEESADEENSISKK